MFKRKYKKQNKILRALLKLMNVYAIDREKFNFINPDNINNSKNLHIFNDKSLNLSLGYVNLDRKINNLDIYLRFAPSIDLWNTKNSSWKRIIPNINKETLIKVCAYSLKNSLIHFLKKNTLKVSLNLICDNSNESFNQELMNIVENKYFDINLSMSKKKGNRGSFLECCDLANNAKDLILFVEDDYLFEENFVEESLYTYSKISSLFKKDIFLCPSDYTFFYDKNYQTYLLMGKDFRWRYVEESLLTFIFSKTIYNQFKNEIRRIGEEECDPFEKPLHDLYKKIPCFAPVGPLSYHISRTVPDINEKWLDLWNKYYREVSGGP